MRAILILTAFTIAAAIPAQAQTFDVQQRNQALQEQINIQNQLKSLENTYINARRYTSNACNGTYSNERDCTIAQLQEQQAFNNLESYRSRVGGSYSFQTDAYSRRDIYIPQGYDTGFISNNAQSQFEMGRKLGHMLGDALMGNTNRRSQGNMVTGYGPPPDLAYDVSPLEAEQTPTQRWQPTEVYMDENYFPERPVTIPIPLPKPVNETKTQSEVVVVEKKTTTADVATPAVKTETTVVTTKVESVKKPVRIIEPDSMWVPNNSSKWGETLGNDAQSFIIMAIILIVLVLALFIRHSLRYRPKPRPVAVPADALAGEPLSPVQNESLEHEVQTARAEAQQRSDQMVAAATAEAEDVAFRQRVAAMPLVQKLKRVRRPRVKKTKPLERRTKAEIVAAYNNLVVSVKELFGAIFGLPKVKLLPAPDQASDSKP